MESRLCLNCLVTDSKLGDLLLKQKLPTLSTMFSFKLFLSIILYVKTEKCHKNNFNEEIKKISVLIFNIDKGALIKQCF